MSRTSDLAHPDWCILDLDPKGASFANVVAVARAIHELLARVVCARLLAIATVVRSPKDRGAAARLE